MSSRTSYPAFEAGTPGKKADGVVQEEGAAESVAPRLGRFLDGARGRGSTLPHGAEIRMVGKS
jgi:hypothetical protein